MTGLILAGIPILVGGGILLLLLALTKIMPGDPATVKGAAPAAVTVPARGPEYVQLAGARKSNYRRGVLVLLALAVLTAVELVIALMTGNIVPLFLTALAKAALILVYFMHVRTLWSEEAH